MRPPTHRPPTTVVATLLALSISVLWLGAALGGVAWWVVVAASLGIGAAAWIGLRALERGGREASDLDATVRELESVLPPEDSAPGGNSLAARLRAQLANGAEAGRALRALLDATDEAVIACDADSMVVVANRSAMGLLAPGSSRPVVGEPLEQLLTDSRALRAVTGARRGEAARARARLLTGEGPRIVEVAAEPISGGPFAIEDPPAVVITLRDVTEQAIAMQLKTDFVANASHELRTPLASIRTAAETMLEIGNESPAMQTKLATMISSNAERLEELARDLLDLSRLESPETECEIVRADLRDIASGLAELFATSCTERGIELVFEIEPAHADIWTDEKLIRLVLRNLIDNAIKFAYEGTAVRVVASQVAAEAATPGNGAPPSTGRGTLRLQIIDRGIGIPLPQQQRVFERFYQVDEARTGSPRRRGTGLGLAIVKHALRALHGTIRVESVWQQGTTMTVDLPDCLELPAPDQATA
ncbi:MAG: sensor histidine kinase [Phycisphaerales bacterium JB054]